MKRRQAKTMMGVIFILLSINVPAQTESSTVAQYKPTWPSGQRWKVEVERTTEPKSVPTDELKHFKPTKYRMVYQFVVEGSRVLAGESCDSIKVQCVGLEGADATEASFYRLFFRQSDKTLKEVQRLNKESGIVEARKTFEPGPVDATDWVGFLPLAFPSFDAAQAGKEPPVRMSKNGSVEFKPSGLCRQTEEITRISADGKETDALKMTLEKERCDGPSRRTTETWIMGMPWWVEAAHDRDGHQWCSARLLKD